MRAPLSIAALLALTACQYPGAGGMPTGPTGAPEQLIATEATQYMTGSTINFRLVNQTRRALGYNLCRSRLERRDDSGDWQPVMPALAEVCTAELRTLYPGQAVRYTFKPEGRLRRGEYRISTDLQDSAGRARVLAVSNSFSIGRDD